MRIVVLGGTGFIGPAIVHALVEAGHVVRVVHRGRAETAGGPDVPHVHCDRRDGAALRAALRDHGTEVLVDTCAYARADADTAREALPDGVRAVVLSSMDVYRAFGAVRAGGQTDPVPLDESSPIREQRYLYRGVAVPLSDMDAETYEKLDVEESYLEAGAIILRLPMVYGEGDTLRREDFILRRIRAGRRQIPFGAGTFLWSRGWVRDVAKAVCLAAETDAAAGTVLNVCERRTWTMEQWARHILAVAGSEAELVRVADDLLPDDLRLTRAISQHLLVDAAKARRVLGWADTDPDEALAQSVGWHLTNPPPDGGDDFSADGRALAAGAERAS